MCATGVLWKAIVADMSAPTIRFRCYFVGAHLGATML